MKAKLLLFFSLAIVFSFIILTGNVFANVGTCSVTSSSLIDGLVTSPTTGSNDTFSVKSGGCIIGDDAIIKLEAAEIAVVTDYSSLKRKYYTESKLPRSGASRQIWDTATLPQTESYFTTTNLANNSIHLLLDDLAITNGLSFTPTKTAVVFVEGDLNIRTNLTTTWGNPAVGPGFVFIVKGNINIESTVTQINGVFVSSGNICTGYNFTTNTCDAKVITQKLTVNGGLIGLYNDSDPATDKITFNRSLTDNSATPAEEIIFDPKFLVITKELLGTDLLIPINTQ